MYTIKTISHNKHARVRDIVLWLFCLVCLLNIPTVAQENQPPNLSTGMESSTILPTMEELETLIKQLDEAKEQEADENQKTRFANIIYVYEKTMVGLAEAQKFEAVTAEFQDARKSAPERLSAIKDQLAQIPTEPTIEEPYAEWSLTQIEQHFAQMEAELANAKKHVADRESEAKHRNERRTEIPQALVRVEEQLEHVRRELSIKPGPEVAVELAQAQRLLLLVTERALTKELESYREEILSYDARGDLLSARRDLATRQVAQYEKLVRQWQDILTSRRQVEAEQDAEKARQASLAAAQSHPAIRKLAEENAQLAELRTGPEGLVATNAAKATDLKIIDKQLMELSRDFNSVKAKVEAAGLTDVIGVILLGKRSNLPDVRKHQLNIKTRRSETAKARFEWIKYDEQHVELADIEEAASIILRVLEASLDQDQRQEIETEIRKLLKARREVIKVLIDEYEIYLGNLADLDVKERQLVAKAKEYANYIDENILWVKNTEPLKLSTFPQAWETLIWLVNPQRWWQVLQAIGRDLRASSPVYGIVVLLVIALFLSKHRLTNRLSKISDLLHKKYTDRFIHTLRVFLFTLILAMPFPAILFFFWWRLSWSCPTCR